MRNGINLSNLGYCSPPKQRYKCRDCNKQFVLNPEKHISQEKKDIIDKLLLEKISLRRIARSVGVSGVWGEQHPVATQIGEE